MMRWANLKSFFVKVCEPYLKASPYERIQWLVLVCIFSAVCVGAEFYIYKNWGIGIDTQVTKCIDKTVYIYSRKDRLPVRDEIFAIESKGAEPIIKDGTLMAKYVRGLPGDTVTVTPDLKIYVNDKKVGAGFWHLRGLPSEMMQRFIGTRTLKDDEYLVLGTNPKSYDSRYYGVVHFSQIKGKVYVSF